MPSGKYVCFVDPAISDFNGYLEVDGLTVKKDFQTNKQCIENGFDHIIEPKTHEDAVMFTKLEHCIALCTSKTWTITVIKFHILLIF